MTIWLSKQGFGSIKEIDDTEYDSLIEVIAYDPEQGDTEDEVLNEIRRNKAAR